MFNQQKTANPTGAGKKPGLRMVFDSRLMIIEIKWLGDSTADDGHITATVRIGYAADGPRLVSGDRL